MAPPVYTNDMTTIATGDLNYDLGTWDESSDGGWDTAGGPVDDLNLYYTDNIVNTGEADNSCTSNQYTKPGTGAGNTGPGTMLYLHTAAFTVPADGIVSIDNFWTAPPALNPYAGTFEVAEAGISVLIGDTLGDFDVHYVAGSDKYPATDGVYATYFVDPTVTPAGTVGAPTVLQAVGIATAAVAQARGNPSAIQSIRYGRAEVEYTEGDATTPATFGGYAIIDNALADKFNLLQQIEGAYKARGLMTFGTAAAPVYFEDSDVSIVIADDLKVGPNFNAGVVNNALSEQYWTNISIKNLGTVAKYTFIVNDDATTVHNGGTHEDIGAFTYGTNSTQNGVTYRRQEIVQGGIYNSCKFDKAVGATASIATTLSNYNDCEFVSSDTGYAVDISVTEITIDTDMDWDSVSSGYSDTAGNRTFKVNVATGVTLTIFNNTGDTITYDNIGLGTVSIQTAAVPITVTVEADGVAYKGASVYLKLIDGDGGTIILNGLTNALGVLSTSYSGTTPVSIDTEVSAVRSSSDAIPYQDYTLGGQITALGYNAAAILQED